MVSPSSTQMISTTLNPGDMTGGQSLDLSTVMKASQAISGEIKIENLIEKMMEIVVENAGAERGILILVDDEADKGKEKTEMQLLIQAQYSVEFPSSVMLGLPLIDHHDLLAVRIVQYAARTKESVVLHDASKNGNFTQDEYVTAKQPKSVLCTPIIDKRKLIGLVYLENNLTAGAFTKDRLQVLQMLSSQSAISIDNARLYENLEEKVRNRTKELNESNSKLSDAMDALWGEMELAPKIQTVLLPSNLNVKGLEIAAHMETADEVGGDYYDVINAAGRDWIGIMDDINGMIQDDKLSMNQGDTMLIYTDGVTEASKDKNNHLDLFGDERLKNLLQKQGNKKPAEIKNDILLELEHYNCNDDVTFVIIQKV